MVRIQSFKNIIEIRFNEICMQNLRSFRSLFSYFSFSFNHGLIIIIIIIVLIHIYIHTYIIYVYHFYHLKSLSDTLNDEQANNNVQCSTLNMHISKSVEENKNINKNI